LLDIFDRFVALLAAVTRIACILMTIALFAVVIAAIVARYGFGQAVSWTEEVPRYLLIWISFLAAAVGVLRRDHVGFDVHARAQRDAGINDGIRLDHACRPNARAGHDHGARSYARIARRPRARNNALRT
jgi:hypothetical protein